MKNEKTRIGVSFKSTSILVYASDTATAKKLSDLASKNDALVDVTFTLVVITILSTTEKEAMSKVKKWVEEVS